VIFAEALRRERIAAVHMTFTRRKPTLGSTLSGNNFMRAGGRSLKQNASEHRKDPPRITCLGASGSSLCRRHRRRQPVEPGGFDQPRRQLE
jgi:hypothetical protein